jgi:hypothetical protein
MAVARSLASGVMSWVVKTAHEAFEAGTALDDLVLNMLRHTFEARLAFIEGLAVLAEANAREIRDTLEFVDANLRAFSSAILVLDQESYDNATYYYDSWERKVAYDYTESLTGPEWWQTWKRG